MLVRALALLETTSDEGLELARRSVRIREALGDSAAIARGYQTLALIRVSRGEFQEARTAAELAVAAAGPGLDAVLASSLQVLGEVANRQGELDEALELLSRALVLRERALGARAVEAAHTLNALAGVTRRKGRYDEALSLAERGLAIQRLHLRDDHPEVARSHNTIATTHFNLGNYDEAHESYARALAIIEGNLGAVNPRVADVISNMGFVAVRRGDLDGARRSYERALEIREASQGADHPRTAGLYTTLGLLLADMGDYVAARPFYERALRTQRRRLGSEHPDLASNLNNLGLLLQRMGDYEAARPLLERALGVRRAALGDGHPRTAQSLQNLAELERADGSLAQAQRLLERALDIRERAVGPNHLRVASTLTRLAEVLIESGQLQRASQLAERALAIRVAVQGEDGLDVAAGRLTLARIELLRGRFASARDQSRRAAAIRERSLGVEHPLTAHARLSLATSLLAAGDPDGAFDAALSSERTTRRHLAVTSRSLVERQALRYAATRRRGLGLALSIAAASPSEDRVSQAWDAVMRSRALVLDEMASRHRTLGDASEGEVPRLREAYQAALGRLAHLEVRGPRGEPALRYRRLLDDARAEREAAERQLAERSAAFRDERDRERAGIREVGSALQEGDALVAYVLYEESEPEDAEGRRTRHRYAALTLRGAGPARLVPLESADRIDALVAAWRRAILPTGTADLAGDEYAAAERLRRAIWDPVVEGVTDARRVMVVPDGALSLVSFAALPSPGGGYLLEHGPTVHYVSAERDLSRAPEPSRAAGLLAVGGVDFGPKPGPGPAPARGDRPACAAFSEHHFDALPATEEEVNDLQALWLGGEEITILTGGFADERTLKRHAPGKRVLHLATHGFFIDGSCEPGASGTRGVGGLAPLDEPLSGRSSGSPLLLSGLALAGANRRNEAGPDQEDGVLTAEEIASLDLRGVEWAVLSACDTGVGRIQAGEGVLGLRRAFQVAGARTLIMSLWPVEDDSAREWMRALYAARLRDGMSTAEAVRAASLELLASRRADGLGDHPFFWAGFVAAGDWR